MRIGASNVLRALLLLRNGECLLVQKDAVTFGFYLTMVGLSSSAAGDLTKRIDKGRMLGYLQYHTGYG